MQNLKDKVIVITGASSGIGRATALALAREGAILHLVARRADRLEQVCKEARALGTRTEAHVLDLAQTSSIDQLAAEVHAEHEHIDVLINNAGVGATKTFLESSDEDWRWTFDINVFAMASCIRAFTPKMLEHGGGMVVNLASLAGVATSPLTAYTASKYAVVGLSEALVLEYGTKGLEVVVICPGLVNTEIADAAAAANHSSADVNDSMRDALAQHGASPEVIARDIVGAIHRPRFLVMTPTLASVMRTLHRLSPGLSRMLNRRLSHLEA